VSEIDYYTPILKRLFVFRGHNPACAETCKGLIAEISDAITGTKLCWIERKNQFLRLQGRAVTTLFYVFISLAVLFDITH
jgi:hypothetical protein